MWSDHKSFSLPLILPPHTLPLLQSSWFPLAAIIQDKPAPAWTAAFSREHSLGALHGLQYGYLLFSIVLSMGCRGICQAPGASLLSPPPSPQCFFTPHYNEKINLEVKVLFFWFCLKKKNQRAASSALC